MCAILINKNFNVSLKPGFFCIVLTGLDNLSQFQTLLISLQNKALYQYIGIYLLANMSQNLSLPNSSL